MNATVVHFAILNPDRSVTPLCGLWHGGTNWTTLRDAVTCPECLRLLRGPAAETRTPAAHSAPGGPPLMLMGGDRPIEGSGTK